MAKPTKYAPHICIAVSLLALLGMAIGVVTKVPLIVIIFLLPAVIYEVYRTEGRSTRSASWGLLLLFIAELLLVILKVDFNVAEYLELDAEVVGDYAFGLGDVKILAPALMALLSVTLFIRTWGIYTKWLAVVIFVGCFAIIYSLDPTIFQELLKFGVSEVLEEQAG